MAGYLVDQYRCKDYFGAVVSAGSSALEVVIRSDIFAGNAAFTSGKYAQALSHYLSAWSRFPSIIFPLFPIALGRIDDLRLVDIELTDPLLDAGAQLGRYRAVLGPMVEIVPPLDLNMELFDLSQTFAGGLDQGAAFRQLASLYLQCGSFDLAANFAKKALDEAPDDGERAHALAVQGAVALARRDFDSATGSLSQAEKLFQSNEHLQGMASVAHNLGVIGMMAGNGEEAAVHFSRATAQLPEALSWSVTQSLDPGNETVTRPNGIAGLPMLLNLSGTWSTICPAVPAPAATMSVLKKGSAIQVDLSVGAKETIRSRFYGTRIGAQSLEELDPHLELPANFVTYLAHVRGYVLPLALADTYAALGDFAKAERYYIKVRDYAYLNEAIEKPYVWTRMARMYLAQGDRLYRQQNPQAAAEIYRRIAGSTGQSPDLAGPLYSGGFASLQSETLEFLLAEDHLAFDSMDYSRRIVLLEALANLQKIANNINFLGFSNDIIPIHPWRYLQNLARYFAQQAVQAERAYISYKSTAEKEEFDRLTLEQAVEAQNSAYRVEQKKVDVAREQKRVAELARKLASNRVANATDAKADYAQVGQQADMLGEINAFVTAPEGDMHLGPDWAAQLGIGLTYVTETHSGLTGEYSFQYTKNVGKNTILQMLARQRSRVTRDLELRNMDRKLAELGNELGIADAQVDVAQKTVDAARAQEKLAKLRVSQAKAQLEAFSAREFTPELWDNLAQAQRGLSARYLDWAIGAAFLMEQAFEAEYDVTVNRIRFDYGRSELHGLLAADFLTADIDQFSYDRLLETDKQMPVKVSFALADQYPFQFRRKFQQTGRIDFEIAIEDLDHWNPGNFGRKLRRVEVIVEGLIGADGLHGTLSNAGIAVDRGRDGTKRLRYQKSETMVLSRFDLRGDSFVFTSTEEQVLSTFENSGPATGWTLEFPPGSNDVDYRSISNIHLVLYFDAKFRDEVKSVVRAELAALARFEHSLGLALRFQFPDEFYGLQRTGEIRFALDDAYIPFNHTQPIIRNLHLALEMNSGVSAAGIDLSVRLDQLTLEATTDANGMVGTAQPSSTLSGLRGRGLKGDWIVKLARGAGVPASGVDPLWKNVKNIVVFVDYAFAPRGSIMQADAFVADPLASFDIVDDAAATASRPSAWIHSPIQRRIDQTSGIHGPASLGANDVSPVKPGSYLVTKSGSAWPVLRDQVLRVRLSSDSGRGIGAVLRYQDPGNFYFFLMDATRKYRRIGKKIAGAFRELDVPAVAFGTGYNRGQAYELTIAIVDDVIKAFLDGKEILSGRDASLPRAGRCGLYVWNDPSAHFFDLSVRSA